MTSIKIHLPEGTLIGKGRARHGKGHTYTPEKTRRAEESLGWRAKEAMAGKPMFTGPVTLSVWMAVPTPKSWSVKRAQAAVAGIHATGKPDLDNIVKLIGDAFNQIVWKDDSQVSGIRITRRYTTGEGYSIITVTPSAEAQNTAEFMPDAENGEWLTRRNLARRAA